MHMATIHCEMHGEHRQWLSDAAMWGDDLDNWTRENDLALAGLEELERVLRDHGRELQRHRESITTEEQSLLGHGLALAKFEACREGDDLVRLARPHRERADGHAFQGRAHESLKKRHHMTMAYSALLIKALTRPTPATDAPEVGKRTWWRLSAALL
jgi:hypothetical protein